MTEVNINQHPAEAAHEVVVEQAHEVVEETPHQVVYVEDPGDSGTAAGINLVAVLIALVVLVGLVAFIFYALPLWLGTSTVNIYVRPQ